MKCLVVSRFFSVLSLTVRSHVSRMGLLGMLALLAQAAEAGELWLGIFLKGSKIGYSHTVSEIGHTTNLTMIDASMLGASLAVRSESQTWYDSDGTTNKIWVKTESGGRVQSVTAKVKGSKVELESDNSGSITKKTVELPVGSKLVDDPVVSALDHPELREFAVLDPNTLSFVVCRPVVVGKELLETGSGKVSVTVIDVQDPRSALKVYVSQKGDLVKAVGPFGLEMRPVSRAEALAKGEETDIALASSIPVDRPITDSMSVKPLFLRLHGAAAKILPNDSHQTINKSGDSLFVTIHPVDPRLVKWLKKAPTLAKWLSPDTHMPCQDPGLVKVAQETVGKSKTPREKAEKLRLFVHNLIKTDTGIGVLRNAKEIFQSRRGVCRDHAILLATLLRAQKIPCRLCSGLVYAGGAFYYHAWVEAWTGVQWFALDSTRPPRQVDSTHIKTAQGTVAEAFSSFLLDGARVSVLDMEDK